MKAIMMMTLVAVLVAPAFGDTLGNPLDATTSISLTQDFVWPGTDHLDTWFVSDFTITQDYYLYEVWSQGRATDSGDGEGARFDIYDGFPSDCGNLILSAGDGYDHLLAEGKIGADFGGQTLPAGSCYIVFQAAHNSLSPGGNTLIYHNLTGNANDWEWNPGLGQNWSGPACEVMTPDSNPIDVNWQLNAEPVLEPSAILLIAHVGGLSLRRR